MPDKLMELYQLRISETLQHNLKKLDDTETKKMLEEVRDLMSFHVHTSKAVFKPRVYQDEQ